MYEVGGLHKKPTHRVLRTTARLPPLPRPLAVSGCCLMNTGIWETPQEKCSGSSAMTGSTAKPARTASVYYFWRIAHIFYLKVDMDHEVGSRPVLLQALVFLVLQTTSEIPTHANRQLKNQNIAVVAQQDASIGKLAHEYALEAFGRISPFFT